MTNIVREWHDCHKDVTQKQMDEAIKECCLRRDFDGVVMCALSTQLCIRTIECKRCHTLQELFSKRHCEKEMEDYELDFMGVEK